VTTDLPKTTAAGSSALRRRAAAAIARSTAGERTLAVVVGLVLLAAGTLVTLLSYGIFGTARAGRPLLDPMIVDALRAQPLVALFAAIAGGLLLAVLGLVWAAHALRPERRPDLVLGTLDDGGTSIVVSAAAAAEAVAAQAAELPGVGRARARLVGTEAAPAIRVTLWLADDADVRDVLARLDSEVLATARGSLGVTDLPAAVRLELDHLQHGPRVA
jgi:hypothetical protein